MDTQNIVDRQRRTKKEKPKRTLLQEYVHHWYVFLLTILTCFVGYAGEIILFNFMSLSPLPGFLAAFFAMLLGGLISTLPFFILNLVLFFKRKKCYALVFQIVAMEVIGMAFFLYNQVVLTMV